MQQSERDESRDVISLFSGAMGMDIGLAQSGLRIAVGQDFTREFCRDDGSIDWEKLIKYNSGDR